MIDFNKWIRQPTNIHAIGVTLAVSAGALTHVVTGNIHLDAVIAVFCYVGAHFGINDNSMLHQEELEFVSDLMNSKQASPAQTLSDALTVVKAVMNATDSTHVIEAPAAAHLTPVPPSATT
jgi:hypothetical protein